MDPHQHQHHHLMSVSVEPGGGDRFPQWGFEETKELLTIRAELDQSFMETKRNKALWEAISTRMKEKGYNRSADQCKCKWKNLVTRYKGCETMEAEAPRQQQFQFYNELNDIMAARMERIMWADMGARKRNVLWSDEEEESEGERAAAKRRKKGKGNAGGGSNGNNVVREVLEGLLKQQMEMEEQWRQVYSERERERRKQEKEWRERMEAVERERVMMERRWREREEQRRIREEARAEKRDALITALLNKILREDHM